jgi:hypothetical protein
MSAVEPRRVLLVGGSSEIGVAIARATSASANVWTPCRSLNWLDRSSMFGFWSTTANGSSLNAPG